MELIKVIGICLIAAFLAVLLSQYKKEYSAVISIAAGCIVLLTVLKNTLNPLFSLQNKLSTAGIDNKYFTVAFKTLGIGYITQFTADTCRDFGQTSLASKAELAGKIAIFILSVPLIEQLFSTISVLVE